MNDNKTPHSSSEYDISVKKTIPFYRYFHEQTVDLVMTIKPDAKKWLDTGWGTGFLIIKATVNCYKLLKDNAIYITFENIRPENDWAIDFQLDRWMDFQLLEGRSKKDAAGHRKRFGVKYFPIKVSDHLKLFKSAGFRIAEIFWLSYMQAGFFCIKKRLK